MVEIKTQPLHLNSVTPDIQSRIRRAAEITTQIGEMQEHITEKPEEEPKKDPLKIAENLGIFEILGVTPDEVRESIQKNSKSRDN